MRDIDTFNTSLDVIHAIKLLALLYPRNGDLRKAKWSDIDLDDAQWLLKPEKSQGLNSNDMMREVIIPLPTQAIAIFKAQYELTGHTDYVFFSARATKEKIMSENTAGKALNNAGYQGIQTPHGFRASAKPCKWSD